MIYFYCFLFKDIQTIQKVTPFFAYREKFCNVTIVDVVDLSLTAVQAEAYKVVV